MLSLLCAGVCLVFGFIGFYIEELSHSVVLLSNGATPYLPLLQHLT